jgi:hypothetical protein
MLIGTLLKDSSCRVAVTTISSSPPLPALASASAAKQGCARAAVHAKAMPADRRRDASGVDRTASLDGIASLEKRSF